MESRDAKPAASHLGAFLTLDDLVLAAAAALFASAHHLAPEALRLNEGNAME